VAAKHLSCFVLTISLVGAACTPAPPPPAEDSSSDATLKTTLQKYVIELLRRNPTTNTYLGGAGLDPSLRPERPLFRLLSMLHHVNHFGTVSLRRESLPARLLNLRVARMHRRWIDGELSAGA